LFWTVRLPAFGEVLLESIADRSQRNLAGPPPPGAPAAL